MGPSTRLLALLLMLLLLGVPFGLILYGPSVVIVDGDGEPPAGVSFHGPDFDQPLWRLTGHRWFGWPRGDSSVRVTCRRPGGALDHADFGYVSGGLGAQETLHVPPC